MKPMATPVAVALLIIAAVQQPALAQAVVDAVVESNGRFTRVDAADEYRVEIAGEPSPVMSVSCLQQPLSLLLLVDLSFSATHGGLSGTPGSPGPGATRHDFTGLVDGIRNGLLLKLEPGDRLRIGGFAGRSVRLSDGFQAGVVQLQNAVDTVLDLHTVGRADWLGASPIWDVVAEAIPIVAAEPGPRAILLVTDGRATGNRLGSLEVARRAAEASVPIHVVFEPYWNQVEFLADDGDRFLRRLAELTGGIFRLDDRLQRFSLWGTAPPPFGDVLEAVRHTCTLTLGTDAARSQEVSVEVHHDGAVVHAPRWLRTRTASLTAP